MPFAEMGKVCRRGRSGGKIEGPEEGRLRLRCDFQVKLVVGSCTL